ncbi:MAG: hypothetical protein ACFE9I_07590 [Candidatus Hermodarchaeota archaeon]
MKLENNELKSKLEEIEKSKDKKNAEFDKLDSEVYDLKKTVSMQEDEINKLSGELSESKKKVEELSTKLSEKENELTILNENLSEKEKIIDNQKSKLEHAESELSALKPVAPAEYTSEERLICPKCGARGKDLKVEEDKSKVLGYVGHSPLYAKKNVCKKCGMTF